MSTRSFPNMTLLLTKNLDFRTKNSSFTPFLVSSYFASHPITVLLKILEGPIHGPSPTSDFGDRPPIVSAHVWHRYRDSETQWAVPQKKWKHGSHRKSLSHEISSERIFVQASMSASIVWWKSLINGKPTQGKASKNAPELERATLEVDRIFFLLLHENWEVDRKSRKTIAVLQNVCKPCTTTETVFVKLLQSVQGLCKSSTCFVRHARTVPCL